MKSISVSDNLHRWIMDHKDSKHKSADDVIIGIIDENKNLDEEVDNLSKSVEHYRKLVDAWSAQQIKEIHEGGVDINV